ncbi:MAG: hypothetical protein OES35_12990, partial [Chromatiales bacterium]|nr:hypothetical protein [Chromatiales bacterium]
MDQFRAALGRFLTGELDFSGLEQSLVDSLASDATVGPQILALLDELYNGGRLPHQLYAALKKRLLGHVTRPSDGTTSAADTASTETAAGAGPDDSTRLRTPSADSTDQGEEKTRFRLPQASSGGDR